MKFEFEFHPMMLWAFAPVAIAIVVALGIMAGPQVFFSGLTVAGVLYNCYNIHRAVNVSDNDYAAGWSFMAFVVGVLTLLMALFGVLSFTVPGMESWF